MNGCDEKGVFDLGHSFAAGAVVKAHRTYTVCNSKMATQRDDEFLKTSLCDELLGYPYVSFTGDDSLALIRGVDYATATMEDIVDAVGFFDGFRVKDKWTVCGKPEFTTRDTLLVRSPSQCCGSRGESEVFEIDFNSHDSVCDWSQVSSKCCGLSIFQLSSFETIRRT